VKHTFLSNQFVVAHRLLPKPVQHGPSRSLQWPAAASGHSHPFRASYPLSSTYVEPRASRLGFSETVKGLFEERLTQLIQAVIQTHANCSPTPLSCRRFYCRCCCCSACIFTEMQVMVAIWSEFQSCSPRIRLCAVCRDPVKGSHVSFKLADNPSGFRCIFFFANATYPRNHAITSCAGIQNSLHCFVTFSSLWEFASCVSGSMGWMLSRIWGCSACLCCLDVAMGRVCCASVTRPCSLR